MRAWSWPNRSKRESCRGRTAFILLAARPAVLLADIFSLTAIVAALLVLVRVPQVVMENDTGDYWKTVMIACLIVFGCGLVILPLHARVAFGNRSVPAKLAGLLLLAFLVAVSVFGIIQFVAYPFDSSWSRRREFLPFLFTFLAAAIGVFYLSLLLLTAGGMQLVRGRNSKGEPTEDAQHQAARLKRLTWWRIGGAIAVTMATSVYLAKLQQWRAFRDKENALLTRQARAAGSDLGINDRIPSYLRLGPKATDAHFASFAGCYELEHVHMSDSKITDSGLAHLRHFPRLRMLNVAHLSVTDKGLVHLKHLPNLETLAIVNCPVKGSHLVDLPKKRRLTTLNLTRTRFGDAECEFLFEFSELQSLTLNRTRITDRSVEALGKLAALTRLELVGTDIEAERFPYLPALEHLDLSRTRANDAAVTSIARLSRLRFLSLRDTNVTNASIPSLASLKQLYHLDLSDTPIDDAGIREIGRDTLLSSIDFSCTRVTGSGFANWRSRSRFNHVILDRTLTDDKGIAALTSLGEVDELSLAHTEITDACLPHLAQIAVNQLDIRGTQITFSGLVNNGLPRLKTLDVAPDQFTPQQVAQLQQQLGIKVTYGKP